MVAICPQRCFAPLQRIEHLALFDDPSETFNGSLPSFTNTMYQLWNPGLQGISNHKGNPNAILSLLGNIAVVMSMVQDPKVKKLFEDTNTRIYQAFHGIDALLRKKASCNQPITSAGGGGPLSATWAPAYSSWIAKKVSSQNALIVSTASALGDSLLQYQANNNGAGNKLATAFQSFTRAYVINTMTFNYDLSGLANAPMIIQRDQEACIPSSTPASVPATPSASAPPSMTSAPPPITFSSLPSVTMSTPIPAPKDTSIPPPPASLPSLAGIATYAIRVYHYASCAQSPCTDSAHVYDIKPGTAVSPCSGPGVFSQPLISASTPDAAVQVGPFTSNGFVDCVFSGTATGGSLTCPGLAQGTPINCVVPKVPMNVNCGVPVNAIADFAWELGYCEW